MSTKFGHIELFVKEPLKTKDFYIDVLGFNLDTIQHDMIVWLYKDDKILMLRPGNPQSAAENYQSTRAGFVLYTDDLEAEKTKLSSLGLVFKGIDGSDSCLTFTDPDGNWFQLVNPNHV